MHLIVASIFIAVHASPAITAQGPFADVGRDTTIAARSDTTRSRGISPVDAPVPALGTVESAVAVSFATSERTLPLEESRTDGTPWFTRVDDSLRGVATAFDTTSRSQRPRAIEYSDAYHTRLTIHQIGAYAMLPLFVGEYFIGQKLLTSTTRDHNLKSAHSLIAGALGIVFVSNTITGAWNLWDAREDPKGRTRREIHSVLMLASDAGFVWTAVSAGNARRSLVDARKHRTIAISSIALSAVGSGLMWLWRN